jgi:hypothetical protein
MLPALATSFGMVLSPAVRPLPGPLELPLGNVTPSPTASRAALKSDLLRNLHASRGPVAVSGPLSRLVEDLEGESLVPATSDFLAFGLGGRWSLVAVGEEPPLPNLRLEVEQCIDIEDGVLRSVAAFELEPDAPGGEVIAGRLEVEADITFTTRADTVQLRTRSRKLALPRQAAESLDLSSLMSMLHARLSPEFRATEGVRISLQTTYLDEDMRLTRCLTRSLAGCCTVHIRLAAE